MVYNVYVTEGLVLRARREREGDLLVHLLTAEYGRLWATARGVRKPASKLRGSLQLGSLGKFGLIRTKRGWQVINSIVEETWWDFSLGQRQVLENILGLLARVLPEEEGQKELFAELQRSFLKLQKIEDSLLSDFELELKVVVLSRLGYIELEKTPSKVGAGVLTDESRREYRGVVEQALEYSHL